MLTLFKDQTQEQLDPRSWFRLQWRKHLDQGHIPGPEQLTQSWFKEYGTLAPSMLTEWIEKLNPCWPTLQARADDREIFCHSPLLCEAVGHGPRALHCPLEAEDWNLWIETVAIKLGADFNFSHPCVSHLLVTSSGQWRVTLLHHSVASNKYHKAFFRQIATQVRRVSDYTSNPDAIHLLQQLVQQKENLLIAGSTGSGKTSLLSTLLQLSHPAEHLVILEDTLEIQAPHERLTRLIAKSHSGHSLTEYLTHALRLSPDRLVLGEMRSKEVIAYLLAMNTGHRGMLSTLHASSAVDATLRVAQLFCLASGAQEINYTEVLRLVTRNVGHVVFVENRQIKEIIRIYGCDETQPLYDRIF